MTAWAEDKDLEVWLLERYCSGTASAEEAAQIEEWFHEHPEQRVWYEQFRADLRKGGFFAFTTERRHAAWVEILREARLRCPETEAVLMELVQSGDGTAGLADQQKSDNLPLRPEGLLQAFPPARQKRGFWRTLPRGGFKAQPLRRGGWSAAAALVLGVVVLMIGWNSGVWHVRQRAALASLVYTTGNGERANITLPDGGTVMLNVSSRIEVPQDFAIRDRVVYLQGQADFRVAHQGEAPFIVEAGGTRTVVLGTEFEVRAYGAGPVQVAVRTGRVMVRSVVLGARDIATVTSNSMMVAHNQDLDATLGFTQGRLVLNNVPLREALPDLERWYDVKIQLRDLGVGAIPVHAVLTNGSIGDLMEALRVTLGLHVVCEGRTLTLDRR